MIRPQELISPGYVELQRVLHASPKGYGGKGKKWADTVVWLCKRFGAYSVLDYGCGQASLSIALTAKAVHCRNYDPAIPGRDDMPGFADLVVATDVLEHVEPTCIGAVLRHINMLARKAVFLVVALDPANKILADGRNAHILLKPAEWWEATVAEYGLTLMDVPDLPLPVQYSPAKRQKRWIAVLRPSGT